MQNGVFTKFSKYRAKQFERIARCPDFNEVEYFWFFLEILRQLSQVVYSYVAYGIRYGPMTSILLHPIHHNMASEIDPQNIIDIIIYRTVYMAYIGFMVATETYEPFNRFLKPN